MLPSRLIFVDGLPGSGKSTTAQRLSLHLRRQGYPARWIFEHENQHPLFVESAVRALREQQPNAAPALFDRALTGYAMLTDRMSAVPPETLLLEGTLFQTAVGSQLLLDHSQADIEIFHPALVEQPVGESFYFPGVERLAGSLLTNGEIGWHVLSVLQLTVYRRR